MGIVQSRSGESDVGGGVREVFVGGVKAGVPHHSYQSGMGMGSLGGPHTRSGSVRSAPRQPMPDAVELERRFTKVLLISQNKVGGVDDQINLDVHAITELQKQGVKPTDDSSKYDYKVTNTTNRYNEYDFTPCTGTVIALRRAKTFVDEISSGEEVGILLDRTNFYAEQGGQIYDEGFLVKVDDEATEIRVKNVQVRAGYVLHIGIVGEGTLKKGDKVHTNVDMERRRFVMANHSATHVLNYALRKVLGIEADQKGSLVAPDRLRFDFTKKGPMTKDQLEETEKAAQQMILENRQIHAKESNLALAKTIQGLRAMFEETYPDPVRVVSVGIPIEELEKDPLSTAALETSVEFCGGTHLHYTGHIGDFVIASEDAIAKGIRRIVALTGPEALKAVRTAAFFHQQAIELEANKLNSKECLKKITELTEELSHAFISAWMKDKIRNMLKDLKRSLDNEERAMKAAVAIAVVQTAQTMIESNIGCPVLVEVLEASSNTKALDSALKKIKAISPETSALLLSVDRDANKIFALVSVSKSAICKGLKAKEWIDVITPVMKGKGGGKPESAQASGTNVEGLDEAVSKAKEFAHQKLGISCTNNIYKPSKIIQPVWNYELVFHANVGSPKYYFARIISEYSGKIFLFKQIEHTQSYPGSVVLNTPNGTIRDISAIAFFLSNSQLRRDDDLVASSQVMQWLSYAQNHITPVVVGWVLPVMFLKNPMPSNMKATMKISKKDMLYSLGGLEAALSPRTYLVGERISLADIAVFTALMPMYEYVFDPYYRTHYVNINRWFFTILNQSEVKHIVKDLKSYNYFEMLKAKKAKH